MWGFISHWQENKGRVRVPFLYLLVLEVPLAQNNPYAKMACFGMAKSAILHKPEYLSPLDLSLCLVMQLQKVGSGQRAVDGRKSCVG